MRAAVAVHGGEILYGALDEEGICELPDASGNETGRVSKFSYIQSIILTCTPHLEDVPLARH